MWGVSLYHQAVTTIELPAERASDGRLSAPLHIRAALVDADGIDWLTEKHLSVDIYSNPVVQLDPPPINKAWWIAFRQGDVLHPDRTVLFTGEWARWDQLTDVERDTLEPVPAPAAVAEWEAFLGKLARTKGDPGDPGSVGPTGPPGADGAPGEAGPVGPKGDPGAPGQTGATGAPGQTGATGAKGDPGAPGQTGATGPKGDPGATGATGAKGDPGAVGATGAAGATGAQGIQGVKGDPGAAGATGAQGIQGVKGDPGATGPSGLVGQITAVDNGHKAWTCDAAAATSTALLNSGLLFLAKSKAAVSGAYSVLGYQLTTPATGTSLFRVAIYDSSLNIIGYSVNSSTNIQGAAGAKTESLTMARNIVADEVLYIGALWVGTGTVPQIAATPTAAAMNLFMPGGFQRSGAQSGLTDLPSTAAENSPQLQIRHMVLR